MIRNKLHFQFDTINCHINSRTCPSKKNHIEIFTAQFKVIRIHCQTQLIWVLWSIKRSGSFRLSEWQFTHFHHIVAGKDAPQNNFWVIYLCFHLFMQNVKFGRPVHFRLIWSFDTNVTRWQNLPVVLIFPYSTSTLIISIHDNDIIKLIFSYIFQMGALVFKEKWIFI